MSLILFDNFRKLPIVLIILLHFTFLNEIRSANRYWISSTNSNWNNTANWSTTSGGIGGASVPSILDIAIFDGLANGSCNIDAMVNIAGIQITNLYTSTITQNNFPLSFGLSHAIFSGGSFIGGNATITFNGDYTLSGTSFTSTSTFIEFFGTNTNFSSGSFNHNNGTVRFNRTQNIALSTPITFNTVDFQTSLSSPCAYTFSGLMIINSSMAISNSNQCFFKGTGSINLHGDLYLNNTSNFSVNDNTFNLNIVGTTNQTIFGNTVNLNSPLPNVTINKPLGTLYLKDYITFLNDFTYIAGNIDYSTYFNKIIFTGSKNIHATNPVILGLVDFNTSSGLSSYTVTGNMTITNTMSINGNSSNNYQFNGTGQINLSGDLILLHASNSFKNHGTTVSINITGTTNQTIYGTPTAYYCSLPNLIINKPSGILYFKDKISFERNYNHTSGNVDCTTYSNSEYFSGSKSITIASTHTLNNVVFGTHYGTSTYSVTGNLTISNNMTIEGTGLPFGSGYSFTGTGSITLLGDLYLNNLLTGARGHNSLFSLNINGNTNQTIYGASTPYTCSLPNFVINKTGGTLYLKDNISFEKNYTYIQGTVDCTTFNNQEIFSGSKTINITGTHNLNNVIFGTNLGTSSFTFNGILNIINYMKIEGTGLPFGSSYNFLGTGSINLFGDLYLNNLLVGIRYHAATFNLNLISTTNQTIYGSNLNYACSLPNVTINKSAGTLILKDNITFEKNYTHIAGVLDYFTNDNKLIFITNKSITVPSNYNLKKVEFNTSYSGLQYNLNNNIIVNDTLFLSGNQIISATTGTIEAKRHILNSNTFSFACNHGNLSFIIASGTFNQDLIGPGTIGFSRLQNFIINKPSGTLTLKSTTSFEGDFINMNGAIDGTSFAPTLAYYFTKNVDMQNSSSIAKIHNIVLGDNSTRTLIGNMIVANQLSLNNGNINLNGNKLSVYNPLASAITRITGHIKSESSNNSGKIAWFIGSNTGSHIFPFGNISGSEYMPFNFNLTGGVVDTVIVSTYPTNGANMPLPTTPDLVTNISGFFTPNNSAFTVNRFWQIDKTGLSGIANLTFTYADNDWDGAIEPTDYQAQRYNTAINLWEYYLPGQTQNSVNNSVTVPNVTTFSPWTLSRTISPLPIELLNFTAYQCNANTCINWETASETNNDYFEVERSIDGITFSPIEIIKGAGNSNLKIPYNTLDKSPVIGVNYYRLKQVDYDKSFTLSKIQSVNFSTANDLVKVYPNPCTKQLYIHSKKVIKNIELLSADGRLIKSFDNVSNNPETDINNLNVSNLESGVYVMKLIFEYDIEYYKLIKQN